MDDRYRNRHRAEWERRRAAERVDAFSPAGEAGQNSPLSPGEAKDDPRIEHLSSEPDPPPPVEGRSAQEQQEALDAAAARRLQEEFDALDQVRRPDEVYEERLLGGNELPWANPVYWAASGNSAGLAQTENEKRIPPPTFSTREPPFQRRADEVTDAAIGQTHSSDDCYIVDHTSQSTPAPDVAAAAAAAGIAVDSEEAALQAVIAQSLIDL